MKMINRSLTQRISLYTLGIFMSALFLQSCGSVPITGRKQLNLVNDQEVVALSLQQYQQYMAKAPVERGTANAELVKKVGTRIASAVETFLKSNGYQSEMQKYAREFNLVKDNTVNAFAMPGGKVVVNTGLLPVTQNETSLAVVMGHEIAHAVAKHANERLSQQMALQYSGAVVGTVLGGSSQAIQEVAGTVFGLGSQLGALRYARTHEYEGDELGIIFMALAGYDPRTAIPFWQRMAQSSNGNRVPELLSTHPSDANRIKRLQEIMPKALQYYKGAGVLNTDCANPINCKTKIPQETTSTTNQNAKTSPQWKF